MAFMDLKIGMIFLFQTVIGIVGNFSLLYLYIFLYFSGCRSKSIDFILSHLTVAKSFVIVSRGIPATMAAFGVKHSLHDFGCKLVFYVHRVARGGSVSTTCLLSVVQAIMISPGSSRWTEFKVKALKYIVPSTVLCWVLHMLLNIRVPIIMTDKWNSKNITKTIDFGYCSATLNDKDTDSVFGALIFSHDVLCLGLVTWASGSTIFILHRHKQKIQHIRRLNILSRSSRETRATRSILVLVSAHTSFYILSSIIHIYFSICDETTSRLVNTSALIKACFPTASIFILMNRECCVSRFFCVCTKRSKQIPQLIRKT